MGMVVGGAVGYWLDPHFGKTAVIGFAIGTLVGGLLFGQMGLPLREKVFGYKQGLVRYLMTPAAAEGWGVDFTRLLEDGLAGCWAEEVPVVAFQLNQLHGSCSGWEQCRPCEAC
jgi:putative peptidoglycan lipid II flippase